MSMLKSLDPNQDNIWLVLILIQAVCKGYQYMTLARKEALLESSFLSPNICRWRLLKWVCLSIFLFVRGFIDTTGRMYGFKGYSIFAIFLSVIWDKLSILCPRKCHNGILYSIFLLLSGILDIWNKTYGDICQFIRDTCLLTSRDIVTLPPQNKPLQNMGFL